MDVKEFKAWFEGFCESIGDTPTPEQFAKIKTKIQGLQTPPKTLARDTGPQWPNRAV